MKEIDPSDFPVKPLSVRQRGALFGLAEEDTRELEYWNKLYSEKTEEEARFRELIQSVNREGTEGLLLFLRANKFFWAPASVVHNDNTPHGLVRHSLKVYDEAMKLREEFIKEHPEEEKNVPAEGVLVSALLHDVVKCDEYAFDADGNPKKIEPHFLLGGHGSKSLMFVLMTGFHLKGWEMYAIRWHMGSGRIQDEKLKAVCEQAKKDCPLCNIIIQADYNVTH